MEVHWTDVERLDPSWAGKKAKETADDVEGVREVLQCLREGLRTLLEGFGDFAADLGLERSEVRVAREVAGAGAGKKNAEVEKRNEPVPSGKVPTGVERREMEQLGGGAGIS